MGEKQKSKKKFFGSQNRAITESQIGTKKITNRGERDFKLGQGLQIAAEQR